MLGRTVTWAFHVAGASPYLTAWVAVLVLVGVFSVAFVAVTAGPGRTRRPALIALALVAGVVLLAAWAWR
ncbi:hypothetical protein MOV08_43060 [Streptomyces yunnanensis]|uniref:Uncharacterized protein n=1 Tax=Streptomyces yunnanensis TaxID=156453 RepID=A0ABY8ANG5_9ACTN|nr:hypothetical protein [Streptomyces yunnanensis]WEB45405.1 hypothetical protein MOV08_43060 [Streptomyces yunnanensis]